MIFVKQAVTIICILIYYISLGRWEIKVRWLLKGTKVTSEEYSSHLYIYIYIYICSHVHVPSFVIHITPAIMWSIMSDDT